MAEEGGEETKVRVVRCPNCSGLLPELANLSVYRCGGCGATLQGDPQASHVSLLKILLSVFFFFVFDRELWFLIGKEIDSMV